jgi:hypothetical protein
MEVLRLRSEQIPEVAFLGVKEGLSTTYLAHAQQFVGVLRGNSERSGSSRALNVFLNSVLGKVLKDQEGGDLLSAIKRGSLDKMLYSYRLKPGEGGAPSKFVTINGMKELLNGVPYVDATVRMKLDGLYQGFSMSNCSFMQATPEQRAKEDEDEEVVEDALGNAGFHESNAVSCIQTERLWHETRLFHYRSTAEKDIMDEKMKVKDMEKAVLKEQCDKEKAMRENEHLKEIAAKDAEKEKEKADKEKALCMCEHLKENAAYEARMKELEFSNLRMQSELDKTRYSANGEGGSSSVIEARAKDVELANIRLQLEQEKGKNKRGTVDNGGGSAGPRRRSVAADASLSDSSSQVVLMPYSDLMTQRDLPSGRQGRRFRWLMIYSAPRALEVLDFEVEVKHVITTALGDGEWMSLLFFKEKFRFGPAPLFVEDLHASGRITGRVLFEAQWDVTHRFLVGAVPSDEIRRALLHSPCLLKEDGTAFYKMHLVVE